MRHRHRWIVDKARWREAGCDLPTFMRHGYFLNETRAIFVSIPKTGCTSMTIALSEQPSVLDVRIHEPQYSVLSRFNEIGIPLADVEAGIYPAFTMVRHPVSRFWSAYFDKLHDEPKPSTLRKAVCAWLELKPDASITVDHLLCYLEGTPTRETEVHVRPQWCVTAVNLIPYTKIAKLERLEQDLGELVEFGLVPERTAQDFPMANKSNRPGNDQLNGAYLARIARIYERDFETFAYRNAAHA